MYKVYGLRKTLSQEVFYIGVTSKELKNRFIQHRRVVANEKKYNMLSKKSLILLNNKCEMFVIKSFYSKKRAYNYEDKIIKELLTKDVPLVNKRIIIPFSYHYNDLTKTHYDYLVNKTIQNNAV